MPSAKKRARTSSKKKRRRAVHMRVRRHQWSLPAGYVADGSRAATLREVISPLIATVDGRQLSETQRAEIAAQRIAAQRQFRVGALGLGAIDKDRAVEEVRVGSPVGRALVEIEHRAIEMLVEEAQRRRRKGARATRTKRARTRGRSRTK